MSRAKLIGGVVALVVVALLGCAGAYKLRWPISWLFPIEHTGKVMRIAQFSKGGFTSRGEETRQLRQFAIFFDDGFDCEGTDTSFAAVREGDVISIKGYHDVRGTPFIDPEWFECDEAQLVSLHAQEEPP